MIRTLTYVDAQQIACIHADALPDDFLPSFGAKFLEILHSQLLSSVKVTATGYFENDQLVGFIVGTTNTAQLFSEIFRAGFLRFLPFILKKAITSPTTFKKLLETIFYGQKKSTVASGELIIIAIKSSCRRKGIGRKLFKRLITDFRIQGVHLFQVSTLVNNQSANQFYKRLGGKFNHSFSMYDQRWNLYEFSIYEKKV